MCWNKQALTKSKELKQSSQRRPEKENGSGTNLKEKVHQVEQQQETSSEESTDEAPCLNIDPVSVEGVKKASAWFADLGIQGGKLSVKIDTGAEVSVLPLQLYNELQVKPPLKFTNIKLTAYGGAAITPSGTCKLTCSSPAQNRWDVKFYVASVQAQPILGLHDC